MVDWHHGVVLLRKQSMMDGSEWWNKDTALVAKKTPEERISGKYNATCRGRALPSDLTSLD